MCRAREGDVKPPADGYSESAPESPERRARRTLEADREITI